MPPTPPTFDELYQRFEHLMKELDLTKWNPESEIARTGRVVETMPIPNREKK